MSPADLETAVGAAELSANDAWLMASAALVLFMTPGLAFFYGGMVRTKHVLGMLMQNFFAIGLITLIWTLVGFSIAFGPATNGFFGGFDFVALQNIGDRTFAEFNLEGGSTHTVIFIVFQMTFAIITPALITGAIADRLKFGAYAVFIGLWSILIYSPVAYWVWNVNGWLFQRGALDFAGGTVVHANAGIAGVVLALVLGKRKGWPGGDFRPHNVPFVLLGASILWVGWFGFNAGSAGGSGELAGWAFLNTQIAAGVAVLGWLLVEWLRDGKPTTLGAASGAVAGLVAITPACGYVSPMGAIAIGGIAGAICALATSIKGKVGIDDSLDVGAVHLVGGVLGALLIGFFATADPTGYSPDGVLYGGEWSVLGEQALAVGATIGYSGVGTLILALFVKYVLKGRVSDEHEEIGLDETQHGESAYRLSPVGGASSSSIGVPVPAKEGAQV
ncbi:ammonium transporter [Frankia sp. CNm7]|uniref:Ammonium transporter n=1 Tax=Frankia nepalensis TaxID=1836974 RepID=A0A937RH27_9ACTN|nr:ammonium transporter [Frankia nepalensis]MBL7496175.1 ammonium transporter [Frankia nepalensis]MBL7511585.1 ammonium transporter [Frankia nepalensis]MBL7520645.1 ammonium transporter [Frankia nepalensis]MBL7630260.1 ammonium transporter [Frankia nepalensis]